MQHPSENLQNIDWSPINDVYESGAIRYSVTFGGKQYEMTLVGIRAKATDGFWTISAVGIEKATDVADKAAREFTLK